MSLADRLQQPAPARRYNDCRIGILLNSLPERDAKALTTALDGNEWGHRDLGRMLTEEYPTMFDSPGGAADTVGRHRKGDCRCSDVNS